MPCTKTKARGSGSRLGAIQTGITTNVDCMVEAAGQLMFGQIAMGIDGLSCAALPPMLPCNRFIVRRQGGAPM
jgi:hypothetical protein